ncbi:MAG: GNAT family N-acetyltransferase [Clostridiaceae bacterium]|nr:GNAT family N-acetyltransferase [Clostridiaceae bacterium]
MEEIVITAAESEYIEPAVQIAIAAWTPIREIFREELGDELYEGFFAGWQASKRRDVERGLQSGRGYVALLDGRVVGFISYTLSDDRKIGTIGTNAVAPDCRGKGIGPRLYAFVQERMRGEGAEFAQVETGGDEGHAPARRAYEKAGFERFLPQRCYFKKL